MDPQRKLHEDIEPNIRPSLGIIQGGGETSDPKQGHLQSVPSESSDSSAVAAERLSALEGGGDTSDPKQGHLRAVGNDETAALERDDTIGKGFTKSKRKGIKFKGGFWNKKRAGIAGGILGIGVGGGLFIGTLSLGPLELLTASHALQNSFSRSDSESSSRLGALFKYARFAKTGDIGETRVTIVGSKIFGSAIQSLNDAGVEFDRNSINGRSTQLTIDQEKLSKSVTDLDGKALGSAEAQSVLADKLGVPANEIVSTGGGKFSVNLQDYNIKSLRLLNNNSLKLLGDGKIVTAVRARALNKFFDLPSLFHLFSKARAAAENKLAQSIAKDKENKGEPSEQAQAEATEEAAAQENATNAETTTQEPFAEDAKANVDEIERSKNSFGSALTKGLTFTGAACIVSNEAGSIAKANRDIVYLPAAAAALRITAGGEQAEAGGEDVTASQVGALVKSFNDDQGHSIFQGKAFDSLRNPSATPKGTDMPGNYAQAFNDHSTAQTIQNGANDVITDTVGNIPGLTPGILCSPAGLITQGAVAVGVSIGSEVLSGGLDTPAVAAIWTGKFVAQNVVSMVVAGAAINIIEHVATDNKLPQKVFSGPVGGDLVAYGSRAAANVASVASGGVALANTDSTTLPNTAGSGYAYGQAASESPYERTLSFKNPDSLASNLAMDYYASDMSSGITGVASSFLGIGGFISHTFASLMPHASAATTNHYDWGFPQYGIPDDMLNDPSLADPYANADSVASVLDGSTGQSYIDKANKCFGATIQKGSDGTWDVAPGSMIDTSSIDYTSAGCSESDGTGNVDPATWRKVIMFVFDTRTMNAAACYANDQDACTSEAIGADSTENTDTTTVADGSAADLAKQLLANPNITLNPTAKADLEATVKGQKVTPGPIGDGSSGLPGCNARTPTDINPDILKVALGIGQKYKFEINNFVSGHDCDTGKHPLGRAMDIFDINGQPLNDSWWSSSGNVAVINDIGNIVHNTGSYQFGFGVGCSATSKIQSRGNLVVFTDSCNPQDEIHIDVRGAP